MPETVKTLVFPSMLWYTALCLQLQAVSVCIYDPMWKEGFFVKSGYRQSCQAAQHRCLVPELPFAVEAEICGPMGLTVVFRSF